MYCVYLLKSDNLSYVGMTNDFFKRFRQHNKEIKGGARYTKKRDFWYPVLIIDGFVDMKSAMQCEWRLKHIGIKKHIYGANNKIEYLSKYLNENNNWTSKCVQSIHLQNLTFFVDEDYTNAFCKYPHTFTFKELYWKY